MKSLSFSFFLKCAALAAGAAALPAHAVFTFTLQQVGSDVVATGSGSINTAGLNPQPVAILAASLDSDTAVLGAGNGGISQVWKSATSFVTNFGSASSPSFSASSTSGDGVQIYGSQSKLYLPFSYVSGAALSNTGTWLSATFASLGLTPGTYTSNFGSGLNADSFVVQIGPVAAAVPEPGTWALMGLGLAGLVVGARRRAKQPDA